jgi:hypothetical protein
MKNSHFWIIQKRMIEHLLQEEELIESNCIQILTRIWISSIVFPDGTNFEFAY